MRGMLDRGFTTVRDACGADYALALAVETGLVAGPRLFVAGRALSQTGGHGDFRGRFDEREQCLCCRRAGELGRVADGVDGVRRAVREEIKAGAHQIKVMASGGIASPTDPIAYLGYSTDELRAICQEAAAAQTYVMAHAYTAAAIRRAVECGVRTIEHGNLVDADTARLMASKGAYAVPTLITYDALAKHGAALGFPEESIVKIDDVRKAGPEVAGAVQAGGVKMAFGTRPAGRPARAPVGGIPAAGPGSDAARGDLLGYLRCRRNPEHGRQTGRGRRRSHRRSAGGGWRSAGRSRRPRGAGTEDRRDHESRRFRQESPRRASRQTGKTAELAPDSVVTTDGWRLRPRKALKRVVEGA